MQYASDNHIITARSVNKKLSFQGWEKCAEAFSQGKDALAHRCAQLSQLQSSHLDESISWSSSDGECDSSSQRVHHYPNRTLASQINFDDCKRVRTKGRPHSSAVFVRSVEKRLKGFTKKQCIGSAPETTSGIKEAGVVPELPECSSLVGECTASASGSEFFSEAEWAKNFSLLNQRINITSSCHDSLNPTESFSHCSEACSPKKNGTQENAVTSPILVPQDGLGRQRRPTKHFNKFKREATSNEENISMCVPDTVPSSPIFKISKRKRVSAYKNSKNSKVGNNLLVRGVKKGSVVKFPDNMHNEFNSTTSEALKLPGKDVSTSSTLSNEDTKKVPEVPISPVIGTSAGKRRKPSRMVIEKSVSPILGSKSSHTRPLKIQKLNSLCESLNVCKENCGNVLDPNHHMEKTVCKPQFSELSISNDGRKCTKADDDGSRLRTTHSLAKRTLDFSFRKKLDEGKETDCDTNRYLANAGEKNYLNKYIREFNSPSSQRNKKCGGSKLSNLSPSYSQVIEDINTEPMNDLPVNSCKTLKHQPKKTKLSLSKKRSPRKIIKQISIDTSLIHVGLNSPQDATFESDRRTCNIRQVGNLEQAQNNCKAQEMKLHTPSNKPFNQTHFIEEEFSEPMETPSEDVCVKIGFSLPHKSTSSEIEIERVFDTRIGRKMNEDDNDIDSCSSLSPENSQQQQIERLPSSSVSSPVTISQTSSPPVVATTVIDLPGGINTDDFNAPPQKGKRKFKRDGLAYRFQRLLNRQHSSSRIWQFKRSKQNKAMASSAVSSDLRSSMLVIVDRAWTEYCHVMVQGCVNNAGVNELSEQSPDLFMRRVIVVLDPFVADKLGKVMLASKIRIFPPWQALKLRGITLILCAYCIEVVIADSSLPNGNIGRSKKSEVTASLIDGINLSDIIFPQLVANPTHLFQCTEALVNESTKAAEGSVTMGTISTLVSHHYVGKVSSDSLVLTILRVFQFKSTDAESDNGPPSWALLGQDASGEICEIVLSGEQFKLSKNQSFWQEVITGEIIGKTCNFSGFQPIQRIAPFRVSNLWRVVSNMGVQGLCDQPVLYMLSTSSAYWDCKLSENERMKAIYQPHFSTLTSLLSEVSVSKPRRENIVCRVLHASKERLYITDTGSAPHITVVCINPIAYLTSNIFKAAILIICDLEIVSEGDLRIDKYSRIFTDKDKDAPFIRNIFSKEQYTCLANLNPSLPALQRNTPAKSLALFFGTIDGVDEESAYMWPACGICENQLLSLGNSSEKYRCENCDGQCDNFIVHMSLQVLCKCPNLTPMSSVRIKLLQCTIEALLPPICSQEGYDMNAVIGQKLGPLRCEVLRVNDCNFTLQQLP